MRLLNSFVRSVWQYWYLQFMFYAVTFWSIDTVSSVVLGWKRTQGEKLIACLLIGVLGTFLERLQPPLPVESREKRRVIGLAVCAMLLAAAVVLTSLGMT